MQGPVAPERGGADGVSPADAGRSAEGRSAASGREAAPAPAGTAAEYASVSIPASDPAPEPASALLPQQTAELKELLAAFDRDCAAYQVVKVLKDSDTERTELVRDSAGALLVRKYFLRNDPGIAASYQAIRALDCPNLPQVTDIYEVPAGTVVVREHIPGFTVREWLEQNGPMDSASAAACLRGVCRAVEALHSCNPPVIHRDVNPNNVLIAPDGPRLIDFGIARRFVPQARTDTNAWGTVGYAAPEQFGFGQSDERTDVFALGMLYWFLLTGSDPEPSLHARLARAAANDEELSRVPMRERKIIARCVALSPDDRYAQVADLRQTLCALGEGEGAAASANGSDSAVSPEADSRQPAVHIATEPEPLRTAPEPLHWKEALPGKAFALRMIRILWLLFSSGFMAVLLVGEIQALCEPWRLSVPAGWLHALAAVAGTTVMFLPCYVLTNNLFGILDRVPYFAEKRIKRVIAVSAIAFAAGVLMVGFAQMGLPAEYVQIMHQNGMTGV